MGQYECVDLTKLNESVQRERLLLPSVEQTLTQEQNTFPSSMQILVLANPAFIRIIQAHNFHHTI